ncbi:MAG: glucosaminidase domain-containing protein [Clostridia bacterium]|nr:glucosaminidase domain-containing protein [Clostridia bacterium]
MKKKTTWATVGLIATLCIICFAVMSNKGNTIPEEIAKEIWEDPIRVKTSEGTYVVSVREGDYEGTKEKIFEEILSQVSIKESSGVIYEEFLTKMKILDENYGSETFFQNAQLLFELSRKGQHNEYLIPAIICIETNGGTELKGDYNYWNMGDGHGGYENFDSPRESLTALSRKIEGIMCYGTTVKQFAENWNPIFPKEYAMKLNDTMQQIQEVIEPLSEEEQQLIDEVVSKISIRESVITKEEFVAKMEKLSAFYNDSPFFSENAELLFEIANEEGFNEYFFPAIAIQETVGGKFAKGDFNYWNAIGRKEEENAKKTVVYEDGERREKVFHWRNFESEEECIREFFATLKEHDIYDSATTLTEFASIWAPNTASHPHQAEHYAISLYEVMKRIEDL